MTKIITWLILAVLIIGGIVSWSLIPKAWLDQLPAVGRIALVACAIIFSTIVLIGYVIDSGISQKIFKRK